MMTDTADHPTPREEHETSEVLETIDSAGGSPSAESADMPSKPATGTGDDRIGTLIGQVAEVLPGPYFVDPKLLQIWIETKVGIKPICGLIRVIAQMRGVNGDGWARQVQFLDQDQVLRVTTIDEQDLVSNPMKIGKRLATLGFELHQSPATIAAILRSMRPAARVWAARKPGWIDLPDGGGSCFVLQDGEVLTPAQIGRGAVEYQGPRPADPVAGSLEGWKTEVAALAEGNPILILAICAALAAPLLRVFGVDMMGFHLHGRTSSGKSTAAGVALSAGLGGSRMHAWNATNFALETLSDSSHDGLLVLDEFPARPGSRLIEALYSLGNAVGKLRGNGALQLQPTAYWRTCVLSTGEAKIATAFEAAGRGKLPPGIGVRLIDIPANSWTHGLFQDLHGEADGNAFSARLRAAAAAHRGHALRRVAGALVDRMSAIETRLIENFNTGRQKLLTDLGLEAQTVPGQVGRVIDRFALLRAAAVVATNLRVVDWDREAACAAIGEVARLWHADYQAALEPDADEIAEKARVFLNCIRQDLVDLEGEGPEPPGHPTGWTNAEWVFVETDCLRMFLDRRSDGDRLIKDWMAAGLLVPGGEARSLQYRLPERLVRSRPRVYRFRRAALNWR